MPSLYSQSIRFCLRRSSVLALLTLSFPLLVHAEGEESPASSSSRSAQPSFRVERPSDYGRYRQELTEICSRLVADGRQRYMYDLLVANSAKDPDCLDCRSLINQWASVCRPKAVRENPISASDTPSQGDEGAVLPAPTPTPSPARLPSLEVLDAVVVAARKMAEDTAHVEQTIQAIDKLRDALVSLAGKTAAEREYFESFAAYLEAPFDEPRAVLKAAAKSAHLEDADEAHSSSSSLGTGGLFEK